MERNIRKIREMTLALLEELRLVATEHCLLKYADMFNDCASDKTVEEFDVYFGIGAGNNTGWAIIEALLETIKIVLAQHREEPNLWVVPREPEYVRDLILLSTPSDSTD